MRVGNVHSQYEGGGARGHFECHPKRRNVHAL